MPESNDQVYFDVIIPTKNEINKIPVLLNLLEKEASNYNHKINIFVCDNESTDGTKEYVSSTKFDHLNIKLCEGGLPSKARNIGARESDNIFLFFLDADVTFEPGSIQFINESLKNNTKTIYTFKINTIKTYFNYRLFVFFANFVARTKLFGNICYGPFILVNRLRFFEAGSFDESLVTSEDVELGRRFSLDESGFIEKEFIFDTRRFERDGFWSVFLRIYVFDFFVSLITKKSKTRGEYFDKKY
ncbi:MAG: glycosyltransferase [Patescibacteria group bacterium]